MSEKTFLLSVYTPQALAFSEQVSLFTFEGLDGQRCVMAGHEPMLAAVISAKVKFVQNQTPRFADTGEGFLTVSGQELKLFVTRFDQSALNSEH